MAGPRRARTAGQRIARRWCVPPAVMRGPGETVDGNGILGEVPGDLGLLLWGTARDVALWGGSPPGERGNLFADGSGDGRLAGLVATEIPPAISASVDTTIRATDAAAGFFVPFVSVTPRCGPRNVESIFASLAELRCCVTTYATCVPSGVVPVVGGAAGCGRTSTSSCRA